MLNLKNLLENKEFSYLILVNPSVDLDRPLELVDTAETPDVHFYVGKNTFLITTAMIYKDNQDQLCDLIKGLSKLNITALAIKLGRFVDRLDNKVIETAIDLNFPLLIIPQTITTGQVYREVTSFILDSTRENLLFAFNIQKKFYNLALENSSSKTLIQSLSTMIKRTVILVDPFGNVTTSSRGFDVEFYKKSIRRIIENISDLSDEESVKRSNIIDKFNENMNIDIYPIKISKYYPYYLIIIDPEDYRFFSINLAIEQAILVLAFSLYKDFRVAFSALAAEYNNINHIINLEVLNNTVEDNISSLKKKNILKEGNYYQVAIISVVHNNIPIENHSFRVEWFTLIYEWLKEKIESRYEDEVALLPDVNSYNLILIIQNQDFPLEENFKAYRTIIYKTLNLELVFGVGTEVTSSLNLKNTYSHAKNALEKGNIKNDIDFIKYYTPLEILDLMQSISPEKVRSVVMNNLGPLANPKDKYLLDLQNTLETYLNYNCDITKTAAHLFVHRNTVIYRIEKCEELLGVRIDPSVLNSELVLSLKLKELVKFPQVT
jgi:purine catabolism regulator